MLGTGKRSRISRSRGFEGGASKHSVRAITVMMITQLVTFMRIYTAIAASHLMKDFQLVMLCNSSVTSARNRGHEASGGDSKKRRDSDPARRKAEGDENYSGWSELKKNKRNSTLLDVFCDL